MLAAAVILGLLVLVGTILYVHDHMTSGRRSDEPAALTTDESAHESADSECCGLHVVCEKDSLSTAASAEILYYDDEELDAYAGREADGYSDVEIEQFRDVLLTMQPTDIAGWARSLQLRGITLPTDVREELLLIVAEARAV